MGYVLGVDLGTTYTAAAIYRDGRTEMVTLGTRSLMIPSVVFLREDGEFLTGEAAERRGAGEPGRFAREFKRRLGDPTPILLGGTPNSPQALMARLLAAVVAAVTEREGSAPDVVAVTYPANWGPFKRELLTQAIQLAGLDTDRTPTLTEPEAAALSYASTTKVQSGEVIAIFDLGGGTFDAAVLRKTDDGFEILGTPEGIEHLGGIDFDEAVFGYVLEALREPLASVDRSDPAVVEGVARLRRDCVDAKEALSLDTEIAIPVAIGDIHTQIRLTRGEFEGLIRPALTDTTAALRRALRSAQMEQADVKTVVLVGGSSRIPLISQLVRADLDLPVAIDTNPKYAVALGAALFAGTGAATAPPAAGGALPPPGSGLGAPVAPTVPSRTGTPAPARSRTPLFVGAGIALALVLLVVLVLVLKGGGGGSSAATTTTARATTTSSGPTTTTIVPGVEIPHGVNPVPNYVIAFTSADRDNTDIYRINSDGSGLQRITSNPAIEELAVWSPDRRTIAYTRSSPEWQLRAVSADGGADLLITSDLKPDARATWSPDGKKLAFVTESGVSGQTDLQMFDLTNRKLTPLTSDTVIEGDPAWSPDGKSIAFWRQQGTNQDLWVVNVDAAVVAAAAGPAVELSGTQITNDPASDADPAWSPDGTRIAFASQRGDGGGAQKDWDIYVVGAQGGAVQRLTTDPADDQDPAWSPDGGQIAFGSKRDDPASDIYVMNADGSDQKRLTNHPGFDGHPAWRSPNTPVTAIVGDWDGTGGDSVGVTRRAPEGLQWVERNSNSAGNPDIAYAYGNQVDMPVVGKFDGVGGDGIGIARPTPNGLDWLMRNTNTPGFPDFFVTYYGDPTDIPVVGDWDGVGGDSIGVVRRTPDGLQWRLRNTNSPGDPDLVFLYGDATDIPVVGNWDGTGGDTVGVVRSTPDGLQWRLRNTNSAGEPDLVFLYSDSSGTPVVGNWDGTGGDTVGVVRSTPDGFQWQLRNTNSAGPPDVTFVFGKPTG